MIIKILGSAAGGGFPQWNCNGSNSGDFWQGKIDTPPQTQSSIAVSADGENWIILNASPDIRQQIISTPELHPQADKGLRNSPIKAVILTNGDVDHIAGLLILREGQAFDLYASSRIQQVLKENPIFNVLNRDVVTRNTMELGSSVVIEGLEIESFAVPGKVALFKENKEAGNNFGTEDGDTIGVKISDKNTQTSFYYIPGCAAIDEKLAARLNGAELVMFDGTLFTDDEMITQGLSHKTGKRMGHISMSGFEGSITAFKDLNVKRRVYVHINNSNPVLRKGSTERAEVEQAGWEIAYDGMEIRL